MVQTIVKTNKSARRTNPVPGDEMTIDRSETALLPETALRIACVIDLAAPLVTT